MKTLERINSFHSDLVFNKIQEVWENEDRLLIIEPPYHLETDSTEIPKEVLDSNAIFGIYTSSTLSDGNRIVFLSKNRIKKSLKSIYSLFSIDEIQSVFCYPQPFHIFGLVLGYLFAMEYNISWIPIQGKYSKKDHQLWLDRVSMGTLTLGTPAHFSDLISWNRENHSIPKKSLYSIAGGARVSCQLWDGMKNYLKIDSPSIGYGCTEASPGIAHLEPGLRPLVDGDIGSILKGGEIRRDFDSGYDFKSDWICDSYLEGEKLTSPEWIHVGDEIDFSDSNHLIYESRSDLVLNRGGRKVPIEKLEKSLSVDLNVEIGILPIKSQRLYQDLEVLLASEFNESLKLRCLKLLRDKNGIGLNSDSIHFVESIPRNLNQKIDRKRLKKERRAE